MSYSVEFESSHTVMHSGETHDIPRPFVVHKVIWRELGFDDLFFVEGVILEFDLSFFRNGVMKLGKDFVEA